MEASFFKQCNNPFCGLTPRQIEILEHMANDPGATNYDLAQQLGLREGTVKKHLYAIYQSVGVQSRSECLLWLMRTGKLDAILEKDLGKNLIGQFPVG